MEHLQIGYDWEKFEHYIKHQSRGLLTGYSQLDKRLIGLPGLTTVMGEPKCCKSTFVLEIGLRKALEGLPVILLERENGIQRTRLRLLANISGIPDAKIKANVLSTEEMARYSKACEQLESLPLFYVGSSIDAETLESYITSIGKRHSRPVLLIVDSLQKLILDFRDRRSSVDYWVFLFNDLKNKYNSKLTIIMVSEKNRGAYGNSGSSYNGKGAAKESGGIEYTTELLLDLFPSDDESAIKVAAIFNRDGDTGMVGELQKSQPFIYHLEDVDSIPE